MKKLIPVFVAMSLLAFNTSARADSFEDDAVASYKIIRNGAIGCLAVGGAMAALELKSGGKNVVRDARDGCGAGAAVGVVGTFVYASGVAIKDALADATPSEEQLNNNEAPEQPQE